MIGSNQIIDGRAQAFLDGRLKGLPRRLLLLQLLGEGDVETAILGKGFPFHTLDNGEQQFGAISGTVGNAVGPQKRFFA